MRILYRGGAQVTHKGRQVFTPDRCGRAAWLMIATAVMLSIAAGPALADDIAVAQSGPDADAIECLVRIGCEAMAQERFTEAGARFSEVLSLDWNHPRAYDLLQLARTKRRQALARWESAGWVAHEDRRFSTAIELFGLIVREDSTRTDLSRRIMSLRHREQSDVHLRRGLEQLVAEDYGSAMLEFEQALAVDPANSGAGKYLALATQSTNASASTADLRADQPTWAVYRSALLAFRDGDFDLAEQLWRTVLEQYPGHPNVLSNLEQVRRRRGDPVAAAEPQ